MSLLCVAQHANVQLACCSNLNLHTILRLRVDSSFETLTCTALGPNRRFLAVNLRFGSSGPNLKIVAGSFCVQITEYAYADTWEQLAVRNGDEFHRFRSCDHKTRQSTPGIADAGRFAQEQRKHLPVADFLRLRTTGRSQSTAKYL